MEKNDARVQMMNFHLAEYYIRNEQFGAAVDSIREVDPQIGQIKQISEKKKSLTQRTRRGQRAQRRVLYRR